MELPEPNRPPGPPQAPVEPGADERRAAGGTRWRRAARRSGGGGPRGGYARGIPILLSRTFVLLCVAVCMGAHAPNLFTVAPRYLRALGLDERAIGGIMGVFPLASIVAMPFVAALSDRRGRRAPIVAGLVGCAAGCVAFELASGFWGLLLARATMGASWAGVLVGASIYTTEISPSGRLAEALGLAGVLTLVAMALGPTIGEAIVAAASFRWMFRLAAALCVVGLVPAALLPVWPSAEEPEREAEGWAGAGKLPAATAGVGGSVPRRSDGAAAAGVGLVLSAPMARPMLAAFLVASGFGAVTSFLADYTALRHLGAMAPFFDAYVPAAIGARLFGGGLADRLGRHPIVIPSLAGQALALLALAFLDSGWQLWPIGAVFGLTHGLYYPALQALVVERAPPLRRARAIATFNISFSGGIAGSAFANGFVAERWGYPAAYLVCAAAALVALAVVASDWAAEVTPSPRIPR